MMTTVMEIQGGGTLYTVVVSTINPYGKTYKYLYYTKQTSLGGEIKIEIVQNVTSPSCSYHSIFNNNSDGEYLKTLTSKRRI